MDIEFTKLNEHLLACNAVQKILPGGKKRSKEWVCGDITGGEGDSFSVNLATGIWAEFAGDMRGGDIISLYAVQNQKTQFESAELLARDFGYNPIIESKPYNKFRSNNAGVWEYHTASGTVVAAVARYNEANGKKTFVQQSLQDGQWVWKSHPDPRPLYRLHLLSSDRPVMVVEGERTCDAAVKIAGSVYDCTTWMGGTNSYHKTDYSPIYGRKVLIIPDNDKPGITTGRKIAEMLSSHCPEVKIIDPSDKPEGWDLADAPAWTFDNLFTWARERVTVISTPAAVPEVLDTVDTSCADYVTWESLGLPLGANKKPIPNMVSARRVIEADNMLSGKVWFDEFYNKVFLNGKQLEAHHILGCTYRMQEKYGLSTMDKKTVRDAMVLIARADTRNEPADWLRSLTWDGVDRVNTFFPAYYKTPNDQYHRDISRYFWAGMARRVIEPGCQLNCMVVLQGPQGRYKSTSLSVIGGKWYAVSSNEIGTKDFIQSMMGKLILEIGELSSFKKSDIEVIKNTLSACIDRIRLPYAEDIVDYPRICILAGTTNEHEFLADPTGARRFYPVTVETCNIDRLKADRDQLFAQALHIAQTNEFWWIVNTEAAEAAQEDRRATDPWEEIITESAIILAGLDPKNGFKITDVSSKILHFDIDRMTRHDRLRIGAVLRKAGFKNCSVRIGYKIVKIWKSEKTELEEQISEFDE